MVLTSVQMLLHNYYIRTAVEVVPFNFSEVEDFLKMPVQYYCMIRSKLSWPYIVIQLPPSFSISEIFKVEPPIRQC